MNNKLDNFYYNIGKKISPHRGIILVAFPLIMLFTFWGKVEYVLLIWLLGLSLVLSGIGLRFWSVRQSGYRVRGKPRPGLTTSGPYAYTRNPLYIGNILMLMGMGVLSKSLWLVPIVAVFSLFSYTCVAVYEEKELSEQYKGEYEEYRKAVPRWFPRSSPYKKRPPLFPWSDVFKTEIGSIIEVFAIIIACAIKEMIVRWK